MIECYFDDSGKEGQADHRHVCLAGYIGHDQFWWNYQQKWRHLLIRHGIPAVHMKNWLKISAEKRWSVAKRNEVLSEFIVAIRESQLIGFGVAVDADVWRALPKERRKAFGNAQEFCFQRIVRRVMDRLKRANERDPIALIFDRDFEFARPRLSLLEHLHKVYPEVADRIAQISFADAGVFSQLQAADVLAWQTRRHLYNQEGQKPEMPAWRNLFEILPHVELDYEGEFWDQELMEKNFSLIERQLEAAKAAAKAASIGQSS